MKLSKVRCKRSMKIILLLLFTASLLVELNFCFVDYFEYQIVSLLSVKKEPHQMPAVTVCPNTFRSSLMKKLIRQPMDVRFNLTPGYFDYIKWCSLTLPSNRPVDCTQVTNVSQYIGPLGKCFSLFRTNHLTVDPGQLVYHESNYIGNYLNIKIKSPLTNNIIWMVRVNPPEEPFVIHRRDLSKKFFEVNLFNQLNNLIQFQVKYRLPPPYHDGCYEYSATKFKTKYKAISDCINRNYKNESGQGYWHLFSAIEFGKEFINESTCYLQERSKQRKEIYSKIVALCNKRYPLNPCKHKTYTLLMESTGRGPRNNSAVTINFANLPFEYLQMVYVPCYSMMDFINTLGGVISLWFNASLFSCFSDSSNKLFKRLWPAKSCPKLTSDAVVKRSSSLKMTKVLNTLTVLSCSLGCMYQSIDIALIYLENNLFTWISGVEPQKAYFPRLTFCVDRVLSPAKVEKMYPEMYTSVPPEEWPDHLTIDQMFNLTLNLEDIFVTRDMYFESAFMSTSMKLTPILSQYSFDKRLTNKYVCFSTFAPHNYKGPKPMKPYMYSQLSSSYYFMLYLKKLSSNYTREFKVFIHLGKSFSMAPSDPSHIAFNNSRDGLNPTMIYFTINQIRQILVPDAFASHCFAYKRIKLDSQEDAIQTCICNLMKKRYNLWPMDIPASREEAVNLKFVNESNWSQSQWVINFCQEKFPLQTCDSHHTSLQMVNYGFHPKNTQLILYPPSDSYTEIRQGLRFTIPQLIIYIGSNINTWLGIAIIDLIGRLK